MKRRKASKRLRGTTLLDGSKSHPLWGRGVQDNGRSAASPTRCPLPDNGGSHRLAYYGRANDRFSLRLQGELQRRYDSYLPAWRLVTHWAASLNRAFRLLFPF